MTTTAAPFYVENLRRARLARTARAAELTAARLEDLEHLAAARVTREAAALRAGFPTVEAMERFCRRVGRHDLIRAMPSERSAV